VIFYVKAFRSSSDPIIVAQCGVCLPCEISKHAVRLFAASMSDLCEILENAEPVGLFAMPEKIG
jgi:hypothetical protein